MEMAARVSRDLQEIYSTLIFLGVFVHAIAKTLLQTHATTAIGRK
jgi:hypothetical protein